jgi:hypothetical protein
LVFNQISKLHHRVMRAEKIRPIWFEVDSQ